jgi:hypothetical protein
LSVLERNLRNRGAGRIRRGQTPDEFDDPLQGVTVVLVILEKPGLDLRGFVSLPAISPYNALQSGGAFVCTVEPEEPTNLLEAIRKSWEVNVWMDH